MTGASAAPGDVPASRLSVLLAHVRVPLYRDGYALVLNSGVTAVLGVGFWLVAAREYSPRIVGIETAAISAMMFLAGVAQLNLMSTLVRWIPILGGDRRRFIAGCYLVSGLGAVVCAGVFLLGIGFWAPALRGLRADPGIAISFVLATVAWCVFNLQDSALTGLGAAVLVPLDNAIYGVVKIVILLVFAASSVYWGIFGAWAVGLIPSLFLINGLIFGQLGRRRAAAAPSAGQSPARSEIVRFAAPDFVSQLISLVAVTLMPVIVVAISGPRANANFSLAWMITVPLMTISNGPAQSLVVAATADPDRLAEYARKVLRQGLRLVIPAALVVAIGSHYVLLLFGREYADHAAPTLTLLALSSIPSAVFSVYLSIYRVQRRMRAVVGVTALLCGLVLLLGPLLLTLIGIGGLGLAWIVAEIVTAATLLIVDRGALGRGSG
jgi:O-antigen/teichoic acid export membrane protein